LSPFAVASAAALERQAGARMIKILPACAKATSLCRTISFFSYILSPFHNYSPYCFEVELKPPQELWNVGSR
jgi:hypothetical protein